MEDLVLKDVILMIVLALAMLFTTTLISKAAPEDIQHNDVVLESLELGQA